ncbi:GIY-YIG nuclease family protein [Flavisolibacter tropicus]|uniref:GIY-YIG nuclease family protein n=1 Tax=Flavisolibacter tropicus TaxID=1492898 RepID=UPI0009EF2311|nr:GIY-YIG nuclease family protein [Flavisolibacter tropicus]
MPYLVYILYSEKLNRFYVGTTDDAERRLLEHNTAHYQDAYTVKGIVNLPVYRV